MHRSLFGLILIAALSACSAPAGPSARGVQVTLTKSLYAPGEVISGELVNGSDQDIGYGACSLHLQRLVGTRWVFVGPQPAPCIDILYVLAPGSRRAIQLQVTLEPGRYRLRQEVLPGTSLPIRSVHSPEFRVENAS